MRSKLLLADDSVTVQRVVELTFANENIEILVVSTGAQAIACIESERPDIVLADIGTPEPDGCAISAFVKGHQEMSRIPVILLSSALEPIDEEQVRGAGGDGVIAKPFEPQAIVSMVRALLGGPKEDAPVSPPAGDRGMTLPPSPDAGAGTGSDPLEAYFDRLDAAFASYAVRTADRSAEAEDPVAPAAVASDGHAHGQDADPRAWESRRDAGSARPWQPSFTDAFVAMFAPEGDGERPAPAIPEELIDEIARRVVARLDGDSMRRLVLETAERMVREEIERIKQASRSGSTHAAG